MAEQEFRKNIKAKGASRSVLYIDYHKSNRVLSSSLENAGMYFHTWTKDIFQGPPGGPPARAKIFAPEGADLVFIAGFINRLSGMFVANPRVKTPMDLKRKSLGVNSLNGVVQNALCHDGLFAERAEFGQNVRRFSKPSSQTCTS